MERIGGEAVLILKAAGREPVKEAASIRDHRAAVDHVLRWIASSESGVEVESLADIRAAGHRVVHGGEHFRKSVLIDEAIPDIPSRPSMLPGYLWKKRKSSWTCSDRRRGTSWTICVGGSPGFWRISG